MTVMAYLSLILIFIVIAILFIIFKTVLKAFFKLFFYTFLILFLVSGVFVYLVYRDATDFKDKFTISDNLLLLEDKGKILTGFVLHPGGEPSILTDQQLRDFTTYYNNNQYQNMIESNYKMFIIKMSAFNSEGTLEYDGQQLERKKLIDSLRSDDPAGTFLQGVPGPARNNMADAATLKASFFVILYTNDLGTDPLNIIFRYKEGNIIVYPETIIFKIIKYMPLDIISSAGLLSDKLYKQNITGMLAWLGKL